MTAHKSAIRNPKSEIETRHAPAEAMRFTDAGEIRKFTRRLQSAARRSARTGGAYTVVANETLDAALAGRFAPRKIEIEIHL